MIVKCETQSSDTNIQTYIYIYICFDNCLFNIYIKYIYAHCLQFEHSGNGLMSHIRETSKVTINTSYFHPAHQHYTDGAQKSETVPSVGQFIIVIS